MDIKQKILDSIAEAQKLGYTLVAEDWGNGDQKCACAIGCLVLINTEDKSQVNLEDGVKNSNLAGTMLGVTYDWIDSFVSGFDEHGTSHDARVPEAWSMGWEITNQTKPINYRDFVRDVIDTELEE